MRTKAPSSNFGAQSYYSSSCNSNNFYLQPDEKHGESDTNEPTAVSMSNLNKGCYDNFADEMIAASLAQEDSFHAALSKTALKLLPEENKEMNMSNVDSGSGVRWSGDERWRKNINEEFNAIISRKLDVSRCAVCTFICFDLHAISLHLTPDHI